MGFLCIVVLVCFYNACASSLTTDDKIQCTVVGIGQVECDNVIFSNIQEEADPLGAPNFWRDLFICVALLIVSGLSFGLAFGFVSLDRFIMKVKYRNKKHPYVKALLPIVKLHSQVLVSLLLTFVSALQVIPLFMVRLVPNPYVTLGISIPILFFFGEIIPCSICVRWTLTVGYWLRPFVWFLIFALSPIAWPVAKILDSVSGPASYAISSRPALKELVQVYTEQTHEGGEFREDPFVAAATATLSEDEVNIILGALNMKEKCVKDAMTHLDEVFCLSDSQVIESELVDELIERGHSRLPVYHGDREPKLIIGMALTTVLLGHLLKLKPGEKATVNDLELLQLPCVSEAMPLFKILNQFKIGKTQMAIVLDGTDNVTPVGIITVEDVFGCLIDKELEDEFDLLKEQKKAMQALDAKCSNPIPVTGPRSISHPPPYSHSKPPEDFLASQSLQFSKSNPKLKNLMLKTKSNLALGAGIKSSSVRITITDPAEHNIPLMERDNTRFANTPTGKKNSVNQSWSINS